MDGAMVWFVSSGVGRFLLLVVVVSLSLAKSPFTENQDCGFDYYSYANKSGVFTSPNYPRPYPRNATCHYRFFGRIGERILITFDDFDVDGIAPRCDRDTSSDFVEFSNIINMAAQDRKMSRYCGSNVDELRRKEIKSDGYYFRVTLQTNQIYDGSGFSATYRFQPKLGEVPVKQNIPPVAMNSSRTVTSPNDVTSTMASTSRQLTGHVKSTPMPLKPTFGGNAATQENNMTIKDINELRYQVLMEEKEKIMEERTNLVLVKEKLKLEIQLLKRKLNSEE